MGKGAFAKLCKPGGVLDAIRDALHEAPLDELLAISLLERLEFVSLRDAGVGGLKAALTFLDRTEPALTALVERGGDGLTLATLALRDNRLGPAPSPENRSGRAEAWKPAD